MSVKRYPGSPPPSRAKATTRLITVLSTNTVSVTRAGTVNTESAWTQVVASTTGDAVGMIVMAWPSTAAADTSTLLDVGVGAAAAEVIVAQDVGVSSHIYNTDQAPIFIPVRIPAGSRVAFRVQCGVQTTGSVSCKLVLLARDDQMPPGTWPCDTLGAVPATSSGTPITNTAWTEVVAATTQAYRYLVPVPCVAQAVWTSTSTLGLQIGFGPAAAEMQVSQQVFRMNTSEQLAEADDSTWRWRGGIIEHVPLGTRVSARLDTAPSQSGSQVTVIGVPY